MRKINLWSVLIALEIFGGATALSMARGGGSSDTRSPGEACTSLDGCAAALRVELARFYDDDIGAPLDQIPVTAMWKSVYEKVAKGFVFDP